MTTLKEVLGFVTIHHAVSLDFEVANSIEAINILGAAINSIEVLKPKIATRSTRKDKGIPRKKEVALDPKD